MSGKPKLWISRELFPEWVDPIREWADVEAATEERAYSPAELKARLADVDAAMVGLSDRIGAEEVAGNTRLKVIANLGVGYNNLDIPALTAAGIVATNTPDVLNESVADYAWALMLAAARRVAESDRFVRSGAWKGSAFTRWLGPDVHGKTLGILGMGRIGRAIARRAAGFSMPVVYHNRSQLSAELEQEVGARYVSKQALLREADFLILVVPLTPESHHSIGAAELALMKPGALLVNVARGGIVDELALIEALRGERLAGAALDVFEGEPQVRAQLLEFDNVVLSPHIASASAETRRAMAMLAIENVRAALGLGEQAGHPPTALNPEALASRRAD
ncbi:2-hydroxyacid dehydrogenase [Frateuria aurantia]